MKGDAADNSVLCEISALLSNERLILREAQRAVTPLGWVAVLQLSFTSWGVVEKLRQHMPTQRKSPNQIDSSPSLCERFCNRLSISRIPTLLRRLISISCVLQGRDAKRFYWIRVRVHTGLGDAI